MNAEQTAALKTVLDYLEDTNQHSLGILLEHATTGCNHPELTGEALDELYEQLIFGMNYARGLYHRPPKAN